jgi:hypothetical protein
MVVLLTDYSGLRFGAVGPDYLQQPGQFEHPGDLGLHAGPSSRPPVALDLFIAARITPKPELSTKDTPLRLRMTWRILPVSKASSTFCGIQVGNVHVKFSFDPDDKNALFDLSADIQFPTSRKHAFILLIRHKENISCCRKTGKKRCGPTPAVDALFRQTEKIAIMSWISGKRPAFSTSFRREGRLCLFPCRL